MLGPYASSISLRKLFLKTASHIMFLPRQKEQLYSGENIYIITYDNYPNVYYNTITTCMEAGTAEYNNKTWLILFLIIWDTIVLLPFVALIICHFHTLSFAFHNVFYWTLKNTNTKNRICKNWWLPRVYLHLQLPMCYYWSYAIDSCFTITSEKE